MPGSSKVALDFDLVDRAFDADFDLVFFFLAVFAITECLTTLSFR